MRIFKRTWPLIFIIFVWFIFSSPYFINGKVPYSSTYQVNFFPPWASYEKFHSPVKNNAMPDIATQIYPWKKFTIDTYKHGQIPLWNPNNFSGTPHLANFQSAVLSPFNLLFFLPAGRQGIIPFVDAWSILILLQPLLAGIFMYLMLRSFSKSKIASLIGSITFMFCGFVVVWMAYGTLAFTISYLPLAIYACQKYLKTSKKIFLVLLTITFPLSFFSGHFQISLYFLFAIILFIIFKFFENKKAAILLSSVFTGTILSLPQLLPSFTLYENAARSLLFLKTETIPFQYLSTIFAPDFFGNPVTRSDWFGHYAEWAGFVGIIPLILTFFAPVKKNKNLIFFAILAVLSLVLAIDSPLSSIIISLKIPVISTSSLSRIIILFSFSIAALSAFGFDNFIEIIEKKNTKRLIKISLAPILLIAFFIILPILISIPYDKLGVAIKSLRLPFALFFILFLTTFIQLKIKKIIIFPFIILFLVSTQSLFFAVKWMPFDPKSLVFPDLPVISAIKANIGFGRMFGNFGAEISSYYGIPAIEGYDPLFIRRYGEFIQSANQGTFENSQRSVVRISRRGQQMNRVLDLLDITLIYNPDADTNQGWAYPVWEDPKRFTKFFDDNIISIYKNNTAMPRASLFYNYDVIKNDKQIIKTFYNPSFDFRNKLILEESPLLKPEDSNVPKGSAEILSYTPNMVEVKVQTKSPALLFLSDNYYPGWKAYINGKETKIFRADYTFRAIVVPEGESAVLFKFKPGS